VSVSLHIRRPTSGTFWNVAAGNRSACKSLVMSTYSFIEYGRNGEGEERRQSIGPPGLKCSGRQLLAVGLF
jgi:hypothetical protein